MKHLTPLHRSALALIFALLALAPAARAFAQASYPQFDEDFWTAERDRASGKVMRGAGLAVLGLAAVVPSAVWIDRAFDNPHRFAALGAVASIAAVSMTLHGFNSVGFGREQRSAATRFARLHRDDPEAVDTRKERAFHLYSRRKTAAKVLLFGSVVAVQGVILLANGVALSALESRGDGIGGANLWPSYTFGGLMLGAGTAVLITGARRRGDLEAPESAAPPGVETVSLVPWFRTGAGSGAPAFGLAGRLAF
jgi:hypothetical protein